MSAPRFYVPLRTEIGETLELPEGPSHHLATVLRLKQGSDITVFNGEGGEFHCTITEINKRQVNVMPNAFDAANRAPDCHVHLGMCILKKDPMHSAISRAVELGVSHLTPVISEHCAVSKKMIRQRQAHWQQVAISACEQCGLNLVPEITEPVPISDWLNGRHGDHRFIAMPASPGLPASLTGDSVSVLIGPEGGFSKPEESAAKTAGFIPTGFGERILRAETAPAVALAILNQVMSNP